MMDPFDFSADMEQALLSTLAYADIFDQPLTLEEIHRYFPVAISMADLRRLIDRSGPMVEQAGGCYMLVGRSATLLTRARREAASWRMWKRAQPIIQVLTALPFVRMLALTGSLAMQGAEQTDDVDLFIVTAPGRLWICRAMILLIARIGRPFGVRLCPNYLVTEGALELPERSLYVARELVQMVPLAGFALYDRMRLLNDWAGDYLPNAIRPPLSPMRLGSVSFLRQVRRLGEILLRIFPLRIAEEFEMRRKIRMLQREQAESREACFSADICKGHAGRYGSRIERQLGERLAGLKSVEIGSDVMVEG
jgi:ABC-type multidrug transport system fused ATPase/permease subunit